MLNIRERLDRHYFERKYGIVEEDLEIIADGYQVDEGTEDHFEAMYSFFENNSCGNVHRSINHQVFVYICCFSVGKDDFQ